MAKIQSKVFTVLVSLCLAAETFAATETSNSHGSADACAGCHANFSSVLPKGHVEVKESGLAACLDCHSLGQTGEAQKNAFSTRIHIVHAGPKLHMECLACHSYVAARSFGLIGQSFSWGTPKDADLAAMKKSFNSWLNSGNTDRLHAKATVDCAGCHGKQAPLASSKVKSSRCMACHGPREKLAAKSKSKDFPDRNPHESHLGDLSCAMCHSAHAESRSYCLECHKDFEMAIPGGAKE